MAKKSHNKHLLNNGTRCIDYLLVYRSDNKVKSPKSKNEGREIFLKNLIKQGVELETETPFKRHVSILSVVGTKQSKAETFVTL